MSKHRIHFEFVNDIFQSAVPFFSSTLYVSINLLSVSQYFTQNIETRRLSVSQTRKLFPHRISTKNIMLYMNYKVTFQKLR